MNLKLIKKSQQHKPMDAQSQIAREKAMLRDCYNELAAIKAELIEAKRLYITNNKTQKRRQTHESNMD